MQNIIQTQEVNPHAGSYLLLMLFLKKYGLTKDIPLGIMQKWKREWSEGRWMLLAAYTANQCLSLEQQQGGMIVFPSFQETELTMKTLHRDWLRVRARYLQERRQKVRSISTVRED